MLAWALKWHLSETYRQYLFYVTWCIDLPMKSFNSQQISDTCDAHKYKLWCCPIKDQTGTITVKMTVTAPREIYFSYSETMPLDITAGTVWIYLSGAQTTRSVSKCGNSGPQFLPLGEISAVHPVRHGLSITSRRAPLPRLSFGFLLLLFLWCLHLSLSLCLHHKNASCSLCFSLPFTFLRSPFLSICLLPLHLQ